MPKSAHPQAILRDEKAVEIVRTLDFDFAELAQSQPSIAVEICIRSRLVDGLVARFLADNPEGTVVEIGAGLDTRFDRLDQGRARWFELDLPGVMRLRRRFFSENPRRTFIEASAMDEQWLEVVSREARPQPVLFVAEGMLYFLGADNVPVLFRRLARRFPGAAIVFDSQSRLLACYSYWRLRHTQKARIRWTIADVRRIESWDPALRVEQNIRFGDSPYYDQVIRRLPRHVRLLPKLFPPARRFFQVSQVRFLG